MLHLWPKQHVQADSTLNQGQSCCFCQLQTSCCSGRRATSPPGWKWLNRRITSREISEQTGKIKLLSVISAPCLNFGVVEAEQTQNDCESLSVSDQILLRPSGIQHSWLQRINHVLLMWQLKHKILDTYSIFFLLNYSGKSWYRIYIWLECGYSIEVKMHDARRQKTKQKTFSLLCVMFITDPLLWCPCWPVCPHSAQYHHWPSCRPGRKEGRYALITFQHILNNGIAKKIYVSFYPTWNNTAVAYLCFVKAEKQVCADDSVLRKHKETSVSLPVSAVVMSASHGPVCPDTACQLAPCSHQPKQLPGGRAALYSCA